MNLSCLIVGNYEQNYFAGGKSASFPFVRSFRQSNRNSKGSEKKKEYSRGEEGLAILEFGGHEGGGGGRDEHFGISKGGLKYSCRPWKGMDTFWNHPLNLQVISKINVKLMFLEH